MKAKAEATAVDGFHDAAPAGDESSSGMDLYGLAMQYKWQLSAGLVLGLMLGHAAYYWLGPSYEAGSQILVSKKSPAVVKETEAATWGDRSEHIALIMSPMIVGKAVESQHLDRLPSFVGSEDPVDDILGELKVRRSAGDDRSFLNVLDITYRNKYAPDAEKVLAALIDAYKSYLDESRDEHSRETLKLITDANTKLLADLRRAEQEYLEFRESAPLQWRGPPGTVAADGTISTNVHQDRVAAIEAERRLNLLRQVEVASKINSLEQAITSGQSQDSLEVLVRRFLSSDGPEAAAAIQNSQGLAAFEAHLLPLLLQEQQLLRTYGADHPDVQAIRHNIQTTVTFYRNQGVRLPRVSQLDQDGLAHTLDDLDIVKLYLNSLRQQLVELKFRDEQLAALFDAETGKTKEFAHYQAQDMALNSELNRVRSMWEAVVKRLNDWDLSQGTNGYSLKQIAPIRTELSLKRYAKIVGAATLCCLALAAGLCYLRELTDHRLKTVADVRNSLSFPVLGSVSKFEITDALPRPGKPHPRLRYLHNPSSLEAENYRSVRTALFVSAEEDQIRVIQVSSPEPGDGKSTLTANLALAIAHAGKRVLLIDADLRRPTVHQLFGVSQEIGVTEVLAGELDLLSAARETTATGLWLLTAGVLPENPAEELQSPQFSKLIESARREFDYVLIDSPPLLVVSDPCVIAREVDGVLLVVRLEKNSRGAAVRAGQLLASHAAQVIGVVANDVEAAESEYTSYRGYSTYFTQQPADVTSREPALVEAADRPV